MKYDSMPTAEDITPEEKAYGEGWILGQMGHTDPMNTYCENADRPELRAKFIEGMRDGAQDARERETD